MNIPEEPTEAEVLALLEQMDSGVFYCKLGDPTELPSYMPPGGQAFKLETVTGIYWRSSCDPAVMLLYMEGKLYTFSREWLEQADSGALGQRPVGQ